MKVLVFSSTYFGAATGAAYKRHIQRAGLSADIQRKTGGTAAGRGACDGV
jgi:hypothetical protein